MGGTDSKNAKTPDVKHELLFNEEERDRVNFIFCMISHGQKSFNKEQFQHLTNPTLDQFTSSRMFDLLEGPLPEHRHHHHHHGKPHLPHLPHSQASNHAHVNSIQLPHFASQLAVLLKGDISELSHACLFLASTSPTTVAASDLVQFVSNILHSYERLLSAHCTAYQSWMFPSSTLPSDSSRYERLACSLLHTLLKSSGELTVGPNEAAERSSTLCLSTEQVEKWLSQCHLFQQVFRQVLKGAVQFYQAEPQEMGFDPKLPHVRDTNWSKFRTILDFSTVLYLNAALPSELQSQWHLVYSDVLHGHSFSRFLQCVTSAGQPTILFVRDRNGHVFGGFAAMPWSIGPKFIGNHQCFLFEVGSSFNVYKPTGYNNNFMYLNYQQQTMPNGLGMGGQLDYFGLWLDQSFDRGHSKAGIKGCTTYGSPQLAGQPEFEVDIVEVWAAGRKRKDGEEGYDEDEDEAEAGKKSILDQMEGADKALLDFVDKGTISDHLREEPLVEETKAHNTIISPF